MRNSTEPRFTNPASTGSDSSSAVPRGPSTTRRAGLLIAALCVDLTACGAPGSAEELFLREDTSGGYATSGGEASSGGQITSGGPEPGAPDNPCEALTPAAFDDAIAALDAAIAMAEAHNDTHPNQNYETAGPAALAKLTEARGLLADQRDYIAEHDFFDPYVFNPTLTSGTYRLTVSHPFDMWEPLVVGTWWASIAAMYNSSNEAQAATLLGLKAQQAVHGLGVASLACFTRGYSPCGNGVVDSTEECDDGNTQDGDGCSMICHNE